MSNTSSAPVMPGRSRWLQLALGVGCMAMIANLQYGWTLFVDPIDARHGWGRAAIQLAFSIFVLTETWLVPVEAWFVDRYGPRVVVMFGGVAIALAWVINATASSLPLLYLGALVGGIGAGAVYGTCVGNAIKWFPDRRGLAAGATAAGFGAGAALTVIPIARTIATSGYEQAFLLFGIGQGLVVLVLAIFLQAPGAAVKAARRTVRVPQSSVDYPPGQVLRTPVFWLLYLAFVMVSAGGLMTAAQIAPIARDFGIANTPLSVGNMTIAALTLAISLDRILDGFGRPFFGWVSDNIGRENTMAFAFATAAVSLFALVTWGQNPVVFVLLSALYFGVFGEIYSLFPATCGDTFGSKYAATNAGMLYTAKGTASLLVPLASLLAASAGWYPVFLVAVGFNLVAAALAFFVVKPLRLAHIARGGDKVVTSLPNSVTRGA